MDILPTQVRIAIHDWWSQSRWAGHDYSIRQIHGTGLSRADVYHVRSTNDDLSPHGFALKQWGWDCERRNHLESVLKFQQALFLKVPGPSMTRLWRPSIQPSHLSTPLNESIIPEVLRWSNRQPILEYDRQLWTLSPWLAGSQLRHGANVSDALLDDMLLRLAQIHQIGFKYAARYELPKGIVLRYQRLQDWTDGTLRQQCESGLASKIGTIFDFALSAIDREVVELQSRLPMMLRSSRLCHWIVGDLWRENILVQDDRVSGVVDFGAGRIDWPLLELVRCLSSWFMPNDPRIEHALGRYHEFRQQESSEIPTRTDELALERFTLDEFAYVDRLSTVGSLLHWLQWMVEQPPNELPSQRIVVRVEQLVARLQC